MSDVLINGLPLSSYSGELQLDYNIGGTDIDNQIFRGINRTSWVLLKSMFGLRNITLTVMFSGYTLRAAKMQRSQFNLAVCGRSEIFIPDDGFFYTCVCRGIGDEQLVGTSDTCSKIKSEYKFEGVRHDLLETVAVPPGGGFVNEGTMPFTDCRLTVIVGTTAASYTLGGATFGAVTAGDVLVFDGIEKKITKNSVNCAGTTAWEHFPALVPGLNTICALDTVTVEYFPTYI